MDGTVCEFVLDWKNARLEVIDFLSSLGIPESVLSIKNSILDLFANAKKYFSSKDGKIPDWEFISDTISKTVDKYEKEAAAIAEPIKGIREVLFELKRNDVLLAICTLNSTDTATLVLERHDLLDFFDLVAGRDLVKGYPKPNPKHGAYILRKLGVDPENACMIGDHPADIEMAEALGLPGIAVISSRHGIEDFSRFKDIKTIKDDAYLPTLVRLIKDILQIR